MGHRARGRLASRLQRPRVVHTLTEVGMALGTPAYMVPEQVTGALATDHCADLYALGVMAYERRRLPSSLRRF
jgi:serine/threonine protein kinase